MAPSESGNFEQDVDNAFRSAVTQAAALGRMVAQMREQQIQRAARREETLNSELQRRYDAERQYARVILSQADHDGWWNTASTERVASVVAASQAWKDRDPDIAKLASRIDSRVQARWGITPSARIAALSPEQRRREAQQLVAVLSLDTLDTDDPLHTLVAEVNQSEQHQPESQSVQHHMAPPKAHGPEQASESGQPEPVTEGETQSRATRLDDFEQLMRSNGLDEDTIAAQMLPEQANAQPARAAVNVKSPSKARPDHGGEVSPSRQRDAERGR